MIAAAANAGHAVAKPAEGERGDLEVRRGEAVVMTINDQLVHIHIEPDAISVPTLNNDAAQRIGLKPSLIGYAYAIGPEKISFRTDSVRYRAEGATFKRRTAFSDRQLQDGADGVAGPETFPFPRTILTLRDSQPDDRAITLPLDTEMGRSQTGVRIDVDGRPIYAAFSFSRAESLVTATGGQWIADANGGRFEGEARSANILYGVSRPIRSLRLS